MKILESNLRRGIARFAGILTLMLAVCSAISAGQRPNFVDVKPSPQQVEWQDLEFGVLIHFGTNTFLDREWGDGTADPKVFAPTQLDAERWMRAIKAAGAKYVVLVAKHHDGFCLWPTEQTSYSVKSSPWQNGQGDLVRQVSDAARKFGLKFGVYLSPWDRHEPKYKNSAEYDDYYIAELGELISNYGDLVEFWLDGAGSAGHVYNFPRIIENLRVQQPNALVFADAALFEYGDIRWAGNEDGSIPYENWNVLDRHGYLRWRPAEADTPLHKGHWFWHPNDESTLKTVDELVSTYEESIGRGGQLMLGLSPDRRGLLPELDVKRLEEFGAAIQKRYAENLIAQHVKGDSAAEAALDGDPDTFWSAPAGSHRAMIEVNFPKPVSFDQSLVMEWLNDGQHVEHFRIEEWTGKAWSTLVDGHPIGHKRIDRFPTVTTTRVRLNILSSSGEAHIREFQLFNSASERKLTKAATHQK
ncbi:MAG TPA: alpha-L-fucosidase [Candidatus Sulfotelmatobacter sp.]|jgi:alpha-L-fucosidase|nr:alpha-L-fucosidase [Candidatus Sulfotelmatobacter sp.]